VDLAAFDLDGLIRAAGLDAPSAVVVGASHRGSRGDRGYGLVPPNGESAFRIASLTKPFTATALVLALRERAIPLPTPAIELLPTLSADWRADRSITVEQLLGQVAGLRDSVTADAVAALGDGADALTETARLVVQAGSDRAPGERWAYYNGNYFLAGAILAAVTGSTYEDALHRLVLQPWGLSGTGFATPSASVPGTADQNVLPPIEYPRGRRPSGGLWSTANDLLSLGEHIIADNDLAQAIATARTRTDDPMTYGLGWAIGPSDQLYLNGRLPGYRAALLAIPLEEFVGVVLTNDEYGLPVAATALSDLQRELTGDELAGAIESFAA
jgi:D-alanyl-D-alanine carboxypeptidase